MNKSELKFKYVLAFTACLAAALAGLVSARDAQAALAAPGWQVEAVAEPTSFQPGDCIHTPEEAGSESLAGNCDSLLASITNIGSRETSGPITVEAEVPDHLHVITTEVEGETRTVIPMRDLGTQERVPCLVSGRHVVCTDETGVPSENVLELRIAVEVEAGAPAGPLGSGTVSVSGGGATGTRSGTVPIVVEEAEPFRLLGSWFGASGGSGETVTGAGAHPNLLSAGLEIPSKAAKPAFSEIAANDAFQRPVEFLKDAVTYLPPGLVGDPTTVPQCPSALLQTGAQFCPVASRVGTVALRTGGGGWKSSIENNRAFITYLYSTPPESGYPAAFAFLAFNKLVTLNAAVAARPGAAGRYALRVDATGIPKVPLVQTEGVTLRFWGTPAAHNGGATQPEAFLTNPTNCSGPTTARMEIDSWENPGVWSVGETVASPQLEGCEGLAFAPTFSFRPEVTSADTPSGYEAVLRVPQTPNFATSTATAQLKDARVSLPEGIALSPSAANGLSGCAAEGPQGINLGSDDIGHAGQDLGDPEATELGAGHLGGNGSPYDDGVYHSAPGHCPASSQIGTLTIKTPLLEEEIGGKIFVAKPTCSPCTNADAQDGSLYGIYLEANSPKAGVIIKLHGKVSADPQTGRLVATFAENPQLPFEEFRLKFDGGSAAPLANPVTCGSKTVETEFTPWSTPQTPNATPRSSFAIDAGANGGGCVSSEAQQPNTPRFEAGTSNPLAAAYSPFVLKLSREDGTQRLQGLNVQLPQGLLARLAGTPYCSDAAIASAGSRSGTAEQSSPSCPSASQVGTVTVGAGPGARPYYVTGNAYLAGPYKGAPLSLAIVTPAVAGPFDLGTVVVRSALYVNEATAQVRAVSDPLPTILDGTPLDIRSIALSLDHPQFTVNPTNCEAMALTAEAISTAGQTAQLRNHFQVGGCKGLEFKPTLKLFLSGQTKRAGYPALKAVLTQPKGENANIARTSVVLPKGMFIANAHINNPCTRVQFNSGPTPGAGCPPKSILGTAKVWTPLLEKPEEGEVYFRSNGGERKLPDLVVVLRGQIPVQLVGFIDSVGKKNAEVRRVRNRFQAVPDAPVSRFELKLYGGARGLLQNSKNLCKSAQRGTFSLTGQNGKRYDTEPLVHVNCHKKKKAKGNGN